MNAPIQKLGSKNVYINIDNLDPIGAAAHDLLHVAGIGDGYDEGPPDPNTGQRTSTPKPGLGKDNIMADRSGENVTSGQFEQAEKNTTTKHFCEGETGTHLKSCN